MESTCTANATSRTESPGHGPFRTLLLYENREAARRGAVVAGTLAAGLDPEAEVDRHVWRFDVLADPAAADRALEEAREVDAVIVSSVAESLPAPVTLWLDRCLQARRTAQPIYVVLSNSDETWTISIRSAAGAVPGTRAPMDTLFQTGRRTPVRLTA
jgi:hypothetical protein